MPRHIEDLTGKRFAKLVVLGRAPSRLNKRGWAIACWSCTCDCGNQTLVTGPRLRGGTTRSCGCLKKVACRANQKKWFKIKEKHKKSKAYKDRHYGICKNCKKSFFKRQQTKKMIYCSMACYGATQRDDFTQFRPYLQSISNNNFKCRKRKDVTITLSDLKEIWIKQAGICPYTGWQMIPINGSKRVINPMQASIDRIDNKKGYVLGNVQFVALIANYAKNRFLDDDLLKFCEAVVSFRSGAKSPKSLDDEQCPRSST